MDMNELLPALAEIHNRLTEISVRGDDTLRMADALQRLRALVLKMRDEANAAAGNGEQK